MRTIVQKIAQFRLSPFSLGKRLVAVGVFVVGGAPDVAVIAREHGLAGDAADMLMGWKWW
jgi:hypothetical protein